MLPQLGLSLRNLLVQLVVVALGGRLVRLLGLLGRRGGLGLGPRAERLALLADVGLLGLGAALLGLRVGNDVLFVEPQLVRQPDGQGGGGGALDVDAADVAPRLGHPFADEAGRHGVDVVGDLLRRPVGVADADGGVGRRGQADERGAEGLFNLLGDVGGGASVDAVVLVLGGPVALGALAVGLGSLGGEDDGDGPLGGGLVECLAEDLGQAVDDAVVGEEDVVLGEELALGVVLAVLGLELAKVDDAGDALAQLRGELV